MGASNDKTARRRCVRLRAFGLGAVAALAIAVASTPAAARAAGTTAHWSTIEVSPPSPAHYVVLDSVSCTGVGSCVAGGTYNLFGPTEIGSNSLAIVASESKGIWHTAREISLPADAAATDQVAAVTGIACPRAGLCTAVGVYNNGDQQPKAFIATESHGTWGRAVGVLVPPHVVATTASLLAAVSCSGPGSCVALGGYWVKSAVSMMSISETAGRWSRARTVPMPSNLASGAALTALSCPAAGSCVAVGYGQTASGSVRLLATAQSRGRWRRVTELRLPRNALVLPGEQFGELTSVSCRRPGSCVAAGRYTPVWAAMQGEPAALAVTESAGRWGRPAEISAAPKGAVGPPDEVESVSCMRMSCVAIASYFAGGSSGWWMSLTYQRGRWGHPLKIRLPANAASSAQNGTPASVDCLSATACSAVGSYTSQGNDIAYTEAAAATLR